MENERVIKLNNIERQISLYRDMAIKTLVASILAEGVFMGFACTVGQPPLRVTLGMVAIITSLWVVNSAHAEMANRYQSLYEAAAKGREAKASLYVKRPASANVAAMWNRAETTFFIVSIISLVLLSYDF
jgi:hypothetical protein